MPGVMFACSDTIL